MRLIMRLMIVLILLTACSGQAGEDAPQASVPRVQAQGAPTLTPEPLSGGFSSSDPAVSTSSRSADVETYYKTMVFIQGTAQLLTKLDIEGLTSNPAGFAPLVMIPGVMDDRVIAANALPVPAGLASAWDKATTAEAGLTEALQDLLMTYDQQQFLQSVTSNEALATAAVAEAEVVLAAQFGASADEIAGMNQAALTEMGQTYQTFASLLAAGQGQGDDGSQ